MVVNHGSRLSKDYFISYMKLIMNSRHLSLERAKDLMFVEFFKKNEENFGKETYENFLCAYKELTRNL
jgi:hypothetical protein